MLILPSRLTEFIKSNCCTVGREQWEYVAQAVLHKIHSNVVFDWNVWAVGFARCFSRWLLLEHRGEVALFDEGFKTFSWKFHSHGVWIYMLEFGLDNSSWKVVSHSSSATLLAFCSFASVSLGIICSSTTRPPHGYIYIYIFKKRIIRRLGETRKSILKLRGQLKTELNPDIWMHFPWK